VLAKSLLISSELFLARGDAHEKDPSNTAGKGRKTVTTPFLTKAVTLPA
jgi:hypothetical protein